MYNVQDYSVLYNNAIARLHVRVDILLACGKHLHDCTISIREKVCSHTRSLITPLFIEMPVPIQESERSCICMLELSILYLSTI